MPLPIQILPREEGISEKLGRGLGTGLGGGLQQLAEQKLQAFAASNKAKQYEQLGLPPQLAYMPESVQKSFFERLEGLGAQPQQQGMEALLGNQGQGQQAQQGMAQQQGMGRQESAPQYKYKLGPTPADRRHLENLEVKKRAEEREAKKEGRLTGEKASEWYETYRKAGKEAAKLERSFSAMAEGARSGNLKAGALIRFAESIGVPAKDWISNSPSQMFDTIANEVKLHLARVALPQGTRITNMIEQMLGQTVAGREMNPDAIEALSEIGALTMKIERLEKKAAEKIFDESGGEISWDASREVEKRTEGEIAKISQEMENIASRILTGKEYTPNSEDIIYKGVASLPGLKKGQRVFSKTKNRFLTEEELAGGSRGK